HPCSGRERGFILRLRISSTPSRFSMTTFARPQADEHAPFYGKYVALVPDGDLIPILQSQNAETARLLSDVPSGKADFAYAPGKWTVKEVIGHLIDAER